MPVTSNLITRNSARKALKEQNEMSSEKSPQDEKAKRPAKLKARKGAEESPKEDLEETPKKGQINSEQPTTNDHIELKPIQIKTEQSPKFVSDEESKNNSKLKAAIDFFSELGFTERLVHKALAATGNDPEEAFEYLSSRKLSQQRKSFAALRKTVLEDPTQTNAMIMSLGRQNPQVLEEIASAGKLSNFIQSSSDEEETGEEEEESDGEYEEEEETDNDVKREEESDVEENEEYNSNAADQLDESVQSK